MRAAKHTGGRLAVKKDIARREKRTKKAQWAIRAIEPAEYPVLADFLYHAIFLPLGATPLPREVIEKPEISVYIDGYGGAGDCGVLAIQDSQIIGAAWTRIIPAYGHVDDETPGLAISVLPECRGHGVGTELLEKQFEKLAEKGCKQTSLSVQKKNPALRLYERLGYKTVRENGDGFVMARSFLEEAQGAGIALGLESERP